MTYYPNDLDRIREECEELVRKRAMVSAGAAIIPIPALDIAVDAGILMKLIPEINRRFGLAPENIENMDDQSKARLWQTVRTQGSQLIGIVVTRTVVRKSFDNFIGKMVTKQVAKFVPLGGQLVAAGLGYFVMRKVAYKHIDDCYAVAKKTRAVAA